MARFVDEVKTAIQSSACAVLSANEFVNGAIGLVSPGSRDFFNGYVNATRRLIGCTAPDVEPPVSSFTGGQCAGVNYQISAGATRTAFTCSGFEVSSTSIPFGPIGTPVLGPIVSIRLIPTVPTNCGFGNSALEVIHTGGADSFTSEAFFGSSITGNAFGSVSGEQFGVQRVDGLPDDCGGEGPVYPPPTNINIDVDITYDDDDGNPISVTIPLIFAPITVNFDGTLRIPVSFDFGGFTFNGSLNLNPDLDVTINLPSLPRGTGQGTDGLPTGDPENEVDPSPPEEKIIGVVVTSTINAQSGLTNILTQNMPNIVAPRLGSVKFAYSLGATTFWSNDVDIKGQRVFIPCPFSQGADAAVASPVPGVSLSFIEIRGFPLATTGDLS